MQLCVTSVAWTSRVCVWTLGRHAVTNVSQVFYMRDCPPLLDKSRQFGMSDLSAYEHQRLANIARNQEELGAARPPR